MFEKNAEKISKNAANYENNLAFFMPNLNVSELFFFLRKTESIAVMLPRLNEVKLGISTIAAAARQG